MQRAARGPAAGARPAAHGARLGAKLHHRDAERCTARTWNMRGSTAPWLVPVRLHGAVPKPNRSRYQLALLRAVPRLRGSDAVTWHHA